MLTQRYILRVDCPDRSGIVAAVANCLHESGCNIEHASQFNDTLSGRFFMRVVFEPVSADTAEEHIQGFLDAFADVGTRFDMRWSSHPVSEKVPTVILFSRHDHCLHDLLYRWTTDHLAIDVRGLVSNHEDGRAYAERYGLPYYYLPVSAENKYDQEQSLRKAIAESGGELVVLARYMQILSDDFCRDYAGRVINIHHSFLPGFKGARPYEQAYRRGVKLIGATAHFATKDLDEGPIIEQKTVRVDHSVLPKKMQQIGRDTEAQVLARAIEYYTERRVFVHNGRTIIL